MSFMRRRKQLKGCAVPVIKSWAVRGERKEGSGCPADIRGMQAETVSRTGVLQAGLSPLCAELLVRVDIAQDRVKTDYVTETTVSLGLFSCCKLMSRTRLN